MSTRRHYLAAADGPGSEPLPEAAVDRLARPSPRFALEALDVPATVAHSSPASATLRVTNVSDVDGRFLAGVRWPTAIADDDETTVVAGRMAAGETRSFSVDLSGSGAGRDGEATLVVEGCVTAERTVVVGER